MNHRLPFTIFLLVTLVLLVLLVTSRPSAETALAGGGHAHGPAKAGDHGHAHEPAKATPATVPATEKAPDAGHDHGPAKAGDHGHVHEPAKATHATVPVPAPAPTPAAEKEPDAGHADHGAGGHDDHPADAIPVTVVTATTELFMEYDPAVAGKPVGFLVHLTDLADFKPVLTGPVTLTLAPRTGGPSIVATASAPVRPGIFKFELTPPSAGAYAFELSRPGNGVADVVTAPDVTVAPPGAPPAAHADEPPPRPGALRFPFLKEQQWVVPYRAVAAVRANIRPRRPVTGELTPVATAECVVSAPLAGTLAHDVPFPYSGQEVAEGETLAVILPSPLGDGGLAKLVSEHAASRNRVLAAQLEVERARRLFTEKAAPARRVEEAEIRLATERAAFEPLDAAMLRLWKNIHGDRYIVTAPHGGIVIERGSVNGAHVDAGAPLARIVDASNLWLVAHVPVADALDPVALEGAHFHVPGLPGPFAAGGIVSVSAMVNPVNRTVPVIYAVDNARRALKAGMFVKVEIPTGVEEEGPAVPLECLFPEEGKSFLFVQISGETFEKREVVTGPEDGRRAIVRSGIDAGERVVTEGVYYLRQASRPGNALPQGHGHEH